MSAQSERDAAGYVERTDEGAVVRLTLRNPRRRNAITLGMWREIEAFALAVSAEAQTRVVVLRGANGVFSAGADIGAFEATRADADSARLYDEQLEAACRAVEAIRQPTVGVLEGSVIGAGAALAASCDLRIAAHGAVLKLPAARLGLGYDPRAILRLAQAFGDPAARWLLLTAQGMPAERAHAIGAIHTLHAPEALEDAEASLVETLAANAPLTLAAAKTALRARGHDPDPALLEEAWHLTDRADQSADYAEGRAAFAQKRPPRFRGR